MESSQEKSLPASERKLQKAREDGQGARSRDLSHLAILGAGAACMLLLTPQLMDHLQKAMSQQLAFDSATVMAPGAMTVAASNASCWPMARCMWSISRGASMSMQAAPAPSIARWDRSRERAPWPSSRVFCSLRSDAGRLFSWLDSMVA